VILVPEFILVADRMFTAGPPLNLQFQPPLSKIEPLFKGCAIMAAGDSLLSDEIVSAVRKRIESEPSTAVSVIPIIKEVYAQIREQRIFDQVIRAALGEDFSGFGRATKG
jgi:hypothetical protein